MKKGKGWWVIFCGWKKCIVSSSALTLMVGL